MAEPCFAGERNWVVDQTTGISIEVIGTADFEYVRVYFTDERYGTKTSFPASVLGRASSGAIGDPFGPNDKLCGYNVGGVDLREYMAKSQLSPSDVTAYLTEALTLIASNQMRIPKEQVVILIGVAA
jgi:hypothetical protein